MELNVSLPVRNGVKRDLENAFRQQMFYWGMDAAFRSGNLFVKEGFKKSASRGLQGTSCYSLDWEGGTVELHGACVGWYPEGGRGGFVYLRKAGKFFSWDAPRIPVPGVWKREELKSLPLCMDLGALQPFLNWWVQFEGAVLSGLGQRYREECFRKYKSLPKSKAWLPPELGLRWLERLRQNPAEVPRVRNFRLQL